MKTVNIYMESRFNPERSILKESLGDGYVARTCAAEAPNFLFEVHQGQDFVLGIEVAGGTQCRIPVDHHGGLRLSASQQRAEDAGGVSQESCAAPDPTQEASGRGIPSGVLWLRVRASDVHMGIAVQAG